jgi:hypothetical protein
MVIEGTSIAVGVIVVILGLLAWRFIAKRKENGGSVWNAPGKTQNQKK